MMLTLLMNALKILKPTWLDCYGRRYKSLNLYFLKYNMTPQELEIVLESSGKTKKYFAGYDLGTGIDKTLFPKF
jgi:hypothetical protein